jgi:hypothetical protein
LNLARACRDGGENLIAETSACSITTKASPIFGGRYVGSGITSTDKNLKNPLDKIFVSIPAG